MSETLFDELGGEAALRRIVDRFVDRLFDDAMIGFFFASTSRERLKQREYEFAGRHLGAAIEYGGRPIDAVHRPRRIFDGQFLRRLKILEETLAELGAPPRVSAHWLEHTRSLRDLVVSGPCDEGSTSSNPG